jgi:hypothetical protein
MVAIDYNWPDTVVIKWSMPCVKNVLNAHQHYLLVTNAASDSVASRRSRRLCYVSLLGNFMYTPYLSNLWKYKSEISKISLALKFLC